ncbi:hypothetical protein [Luteitalea sp.]|uniref:hypothetical protein n=1 Tax=Luteitalea sp. TaxID=2004800 RepID=UPI0025C3434B|nr:hypothetical protein [Luteitalea sp.]
MTRARLWGYFAGTAAVAALFGFLFGWYQAYPAQHSRDRALLRLRVSEARARTLDARIALVRANYGNAREHTEEAIRLLEAFKSSGQRELAQSESAKVERAQQLLKESLGLAPTMPTPAAGGGAAGGRPEDQAEARALEASNLLGEVYRATPEP